MMEKSISNTATVVGKPTPSGLFVYDSISVWPKKIYFEWVTEGLICTTRHGASIWGYRFLDERKGNSIVHVRDKSASELA